MRKKILILSLIGVLLGGVFLIAYRVFFIKMIRVPTGAMANTIVPGDCLIVKRTLGDIARGDLVVFKYPNDLSVQYVSRVIGLPGETIEIRGNSVYINGNELQERRTIVKPVHDSKFGMLEELSSEGSGPYRVFYFFRDKTSQAQIERDVRPFGTREPFIIPDHQYFVMGDNRDFSFDSRGYGTVPRELIWGKPTMIYWSSNSDVLHEEKTRWDRIGTEVK